MLPRALVASSFLALVSSSAHHWRLLRSASIMKALCQQSLQYKNHLLRRDHLSTDAAAGIAVDADALARSMAR